MPGRRIKDLRISFRESSADCPGRAGARRSQGRGKDADPLPRSRKTSRAGARRSQGVTQSRRCAAETKKDIHFSASFRIFLRALCGDRAGGPPTPPGVDSQRRDCHERLTSALADWPQAIPGNGPGWSRIGGGYGEPTGSPLTRTCRRCGK